MKDNICSLINLEIKEDNLNQEIEEEISRRKVYCDKKSVGQKEFFSAGAMGLKADFKLVVYQDEYEDEKIVEYDGTKYKVYRTFETGEDVELYVEKRVGAK